MITKTWEIRLGWLYRLICFVTAFKERSTRDTKTMLSCREAHLFWLRVLYPGPFPVVQDGQASSSPLLHEEMPARRKRRATNASFTQQTSHSGRSNAPCYPLACFHSSTDCLPVFC